MTAKENKEKQPKLVLHVDIRNTLFAADSIGHLLVEQGINSYLTCVAWGTVDPQSGAWRAVSDEPSLKPPHPDAVTYYKYLEKSTKTYSPRERTRLRLMTANFVNEPIGRAFKPVFDKCLENLKWFYPRDDSITAQGIDGQNYHYIFKSFLNLVKHLNDQQRNVAIILRTFGIDAQGTLLAFQSTIDKKHPDFPEGLGDIGLCNTVFDFHRTVNETNGESYMSITDPRDGSTVCEGEAAIIDWMGASTGIKAIKDDYMFWENQGFIHSAGKPFWVPKKVPLKTADGVPCYHIIIDDNIRAWESDSIVNFREASDGTYQDLPNETVAKLEHVFYEQADLIDAICEPNYFINIIQRCESNMAKLFEAQSFQ